MKFSFFIILLMFLFLNSIAQVQQEWVRTYNTTPDYYDHALKLNVDGNGNIICSGNNSNNELVLIKYDERGDALWFKRYNFMQSQQNQAISDIQIDSSNNIFLTGYFDWNKVLTIMLNENGDTVWSRIFESNSTGVFRGPSIAVDSNIYVCLDGFDTVSNAMILKYDKTGNLLWMRNIVSAPITDLVKVMIDYQGNIILTGSYFFSLGNNSDIFIVKLNPDGNLIWRKNYNAGYPDSPYDMFIDRKNNTYILGQTGSVSLGFPVFSTFKYDSSGNNLWLSKYSATGFAHDIPSAIYADNEGNVYITGSSHRTSSLFDITTIKYDSMGDSIWVRRFNGVANDTDCSNSIVVNSNGDIFVSGYTKCYNRYNFINISYSSNGVINWIDTIPAFINQALLSTSSIKVSQSENLYSLGSSWTTNTNYDMTTIKYLNYSIGINPISTEIPSHFSLSQNYPNPFNPSTKIRFEIPAKTNSITRITVYDVLGKVISTLINENLKPGIYETEFIASGLSSGIYFYKMSSGNFTSTKKLVVLK